MKGSRGSFSSIFDDMIAQCAANFGKPPRSPSFWDRLTTWRIKPPLWLRLCQEDDLHIFFKHSRELHHEGRVVWGWIVQANNNLYQRGVFNCPAEVVYSLDDWTTIPPEELAEVAGRASALKGTKPSDLEAGAIADYLTKETMRVFGLRVPGRLSPRHSSLLSTIFVLRQHLPSPRYLRKPLVPLIVRPHPPNVAMILPARYWPQPLLDWWKQ